MTRWSARRNLLRSLTDAMPALVAFVDTAGALRLLQQGISGRLRRRDQGTSSAAPSRTWSKRKIYDVVKPYVDRGAEGPGSHLRAARSSPRASGAIIEQRYIPEIRGDGKVTGFYAIGWDITERHKREQHLSAEAASDPLTGLLNRRAMMTAMTEASSRWKEGAISGAVLYLDIDRFKQINDRMGHEAGDMVLKTFADRIRAVVRSSDKVARLGGDEFVDSSERRRWRGFSAPRRQCLAGSHAHARCSGRRPARRGHAPASVSP